MPEKYIFHLILPRPATWLAVRLHAKHEKETMTSDGREPESLVWTKDQMKLLYVDTGREIYKIQEC